MATADIVFDNRANMPESQYVSTMNAINELQKRLKTSDQDRRSNFYFAHHPVSVNDIDVEMGEEVSSEPSVLVIHGRHMEADQARERLVMDLISLGRWRSWFEKSLKNLKPIQRFTMKTKMRAFDLICLKENIDRASVTSYETLQRQTDRLRDIDEQTFIINFKNAYNMRVMEKKRQVKKFVEIFKQKEEALKIILAM